MPKNTKQHHIVVKKRFDKLKKSLSNVNLSTSAFASNKKKFHNFVYKNKPVIISDFSKQTGIPVNNILSYFFQNKQIYTNRSSIVKTEIEKLCQNFSISLVENDNNDVLEDIDSIDFLYLRSIESDHKPDIHQRPPIVTVMGHVDHGKTTLLDKIRKTNIISSEHGGITQHIGASSIIYKDQKITFIDTPGHELFTEMRSLGADLTDIILLVVAADDGIKPQTIEAIHHIKAANKPLILVINKIDLPGARPEHVMNQLTEYEIVPESLGGDTLAVSLSAKKGINIDLLLDNILLQSELLDLKSDYNAVPTGIIFESNLDKNFGPNVDLLVQNGILKINDYIVINDIYGRVKLLKDQFAKSINECYPSQAVQCFGFKTPPTTIGKFIAFQNKDDAINYTEEYKRLSEQGKKSKTYLFFRELSNQINSKKVDNLNIVLKTDVLGSLNAIKLGINKINQTNLKIKIVHEGSGQLTKSDLTLAIVTKALVIVFNTSTSNDVKAFAQQNGIIIKEYNIIYKLFDELTSWIKDLSSASKDNLGELAAKAKVLNIFDFKGVGQIAGCVVTEGLAERSHKVHVVRNKKTIFQGFIKSLKHLKENVLSVKNGVEFGLALKDFDSVEQGDELHFYKITKPKK
ncbi:translation initiation factor IF-2 [Mycoplasma sp. SG1]|uniref:translation initiation factor IF-2 n=1 Tax=Mycoplasma sp. SG1 TaxID=2810348 RepID=UPI002023CB03|nr:translation initiation factor IF-2 [Mycoplasma sp. SG1]URM53223.1 translation initiation factor IF-2 [Mycoplasma sp. SG1]